MQMNRDGVSIVCIVTALYAVTAFGHVRGPRRLRRDDPHPPTDEYPRRGTINSGIERGLRFQSSSRFFSKGRLMIGPLRSNRRIVESYGRLTMHSYARFVLAV